MHNEKQESYQGVHCETERGIEECRREASKGGLLGSATVRQRKVF